MREIKFRYVVKSKVTGKIHKVIYFLRQIEQLPLHKLSDVFRGQYELISTDPYTGIKDKNGDDIFEGDIIKGPFDFGPFGVKERTTEVYFHPHSGYQWHYWLDLSEIEVIGNVHENPELIGGDSE